MFAPETQELLDEISANVQAIGRMIRSPKNDIDDHRVLVEALRSSANALETATSIIISDYIQQ